MAPEWLKNGISFSMIHLLFQSPFNDRKDSVDLHLLNHKFNDSPEEYIEVSRPINYPANNSFSACPET